MQTSLEDVTNRTLVRDPTGVTIRKTIKLVRQSRVSRGKSSHSTQHLLDYIY